MRMAWCIGPEAQRVEVEASLSGEVRLRVDGTPVATREEGFPRSEHVLPVPGHVVKLVLEFQLGALDYVATLFVDGVPLAPERAEYRSESLAVIVLGVLGALGGVLLGGVYGAHILVPLMVGLSSGAVLQWVASREAQPLVPAVSVIWGQMAWVLLAIAFLGGVNPLSLGFALLVLPATVFLLLSAFLVVRPSRPRVLATAILMGGAFVVDLWLLVSGTRPESLLLPQSLHVLLELSALVALAWGWNALHAPAQVGGVGPRPRRPMGWVFLGPMMVGTLLCLAWMYVQDTPSLLASPVPTRTLTGRVRFVGEVGPGSPTGGPAALVELKVGGQRVPLAPDGSYSVKARRDALQVEASLRDTVEGTRFVEVPAEDAPSGTVPELSFTLTGGVIASATSRDAYLEGDEVHAQLEGSDVQGQTNRASAQVSFTGVRTGTYPLVISAKHHVPYRAPLTVVWGARPEIKARLGLDLNPTGCAPTVKSLGELKRTLTGDSRFSPHDPADTEGLWAVYSLQPCRAGSIASLELFSNDPDATHSWRSSASRDLGVARERAPTVLVNRTSSGSNRFPVSGGERLWLYSPRPPSAGMAHVLRLRYDDGTYDQAPLDASP